MAGAVIFSVAIQHKQSYFQSDHMTGNMAYNQRPALEKRRRVVGIKTQPAEFHHKAQLIKNTPPSDGVLLK